MTQCPLSRICCCMSPKILLMAIGFLGIALGVLSTFWPRRSIGLYQWIMKQFNWHVAPIDETREVRNTAQLGFLLTLLSLGILALSFFKF